MHLFAYGTLMCNDIMQEVSGILPSSTSGCLFGYCRYGVKNEHYPAIIPEKEGCVKGIVYLDVSPAAWERLDRFEGEMYERLPVEITLNTGMRITANTYVWKPAFSLELTESHWSLETFFQKGKQAFISNYKGYSEL